MQNTPLRIGPAALAAAAANIANCALGSLAGPVGYTATQPYIIITHMRAVNKTAGSVNVSLFIGATGASAAGTEFAWSATPVAAYSSLDWYGRVKLTATDFLTGFASAAASITFEAEGEIGFS